MIQKPTFQSTWLPLILIVVALIVVNFGLYTRLSGAASVPAAPAFELPYSEDFAEIADVPYEEFGGDWEIRDEQLVQLSTTGFDLMSFVPVDIPAEQPYRFDVSMRYLGGNMGGGIMFNAQQTTSRQQSHMARFNVDGGQLWLIYGYFGDDSDFMGQGSVQIGTPPEDATPRRVGVQVNGETYDLLLDDEIVASGIPINYQGGAVGFISATSQIAFDDVRVDTATGTTVADAPDVVEEAPDDIVVEAADELVFADSFDVAGSSESLWQPISGVWRFEDGALIQDLTDAFDLTNIYQRPVPYPMQLTTTFRHMEGVGAGLMFNLPQGTLKNGGYMVRYVDTGDFLTWGYFDDTALYNGQGSIAVPEPGTEAHTLAVQSDGETFSIILDGEVLIAGEPIENPVASGYIALTASQSMVAFEDVQVTTGNIATLPAETTARIDSAAATGTWLTEGGLITQTDTEETDYIAGTGLAGEQFTVSVDIALPEGVDNAGAGLVFHMDGRDDRSAGYMVRFSQGGNEVFWGEFDEDGVFAGAGSVPVTPAESVTQNLLLVVREGNFDIAVNSETVAQGIPVARSNGWIGLVSFSGPVTFSNVSLELGE